MTLRAKPVVKGPGRSGWNSDQRKTFLTNLAFVVAIVISIVILIGYAGLSWYGDHFGAAATVDGTKITKDDLRQRYAIEDFRIKYTESRIRTLQTAGRLSEAEATSQFQYLEQRRQTLSSVALERLIDVMIQAKLATKEGVSISEADIDAQLLRESTIVEERHTWAIEVAPANDAATGKPGPTDIAAAKARADAALARLKSGSSWDDVAKSTSDAPTAAQSGDLGWLPQDSGYDVPFMTAVFAVPTETPTAVIEGDDGVFRIGRTTEVAPETVDQTFAGRLQESEIKAEDYRAVVRGDLVRKALDDKLVADLSKPSLQRHVAQIFLASATPQPIGVKVRHILVSPKDDPSGAAALAADDPAWTAAKEEAQALYEQLVADPTKFDALARTKSDEPSATSSGGKLPYYEPTSGIDEAFAKAIFAPGLQPGQLIPPFKSAFGWHVVQYMRPYGNGEVEWAGKLRDQLTAGADFTQMARDQGEGPESADGGDLGWIAKGQLENLKETPIFSTAIGQMSVVTNIPSQGVYLWKVLAEETRTPTKEQIKGFQDNAFSDWYATKKAGVTITREIVPTGVSQ
ncbi:MAG: peptidylprolyl isomerase [Chloroflexota bacterium]